MMEEIVSLKNRLVKNTAILKQKKYRDETGLFIAEGVRLVEDAANSDWEIACAFCTEKGLGDERGAKAIAKLKERGTKVYKVKNEIYAKMCDTDAPQGIMAVVRKKLCGEKDLLAKGDAPFIVVLDGLQDPGNVGTIIRTAEAAGCSGVIMTKKTADLFSCKVVRATMGAVFRLPIVNGASPESVVEFAKSRGLIIKATALDGAAEYYRADMTEPLLLVLGNEGSGVSEYFLANAAERLFIPMRGGAESLNVAAAAAVLIYEAVRQRYF
jgi:TrmH family RNA methyltransferase